MGIVSFLELSDDLCDLLVRSGAKVDPRNTFFEDLFGSYIIGFWLLLFFGWFVRWFNHTFVCTENN